MNKSLLLIIADFLLLSLLALARFEETPEQIEEGVQEEAQATQDLIEVLQMSLEEERLSREELNKSLDKTKTELENTLKEKKDKEENLSDLEDKHKNLEEKTKKLEEVAAEKEKIEKEFKETREKLDKAQEDRMALSKDLSVVKQKQAASREKLKLIQEKLLERETEIEKVTSRLEKISSDHRVSELEKQKLETQLEVIRTERTMLTQNLDVAQSEIKVLEVEKQKAEAHAHKLAQGVTNLAENSELLHEEIQKMQPITMNKIFDAYKANKVLIEFKSVHKNMLGQQDKVHKAFGVLVGDSDKAYALVFEKLTPFTTMNLSAASGLLRFGDKEFPLKEIYSLQGETRIVAAPVDMEWVKETGIRVFNLSIDPLRFPKSIVISQENKFGEILLKQHPQFANFFKRESRIFSSLPGEISAGTGDVVFTKTGHFMGFMVNDKYTVLLSNLDVDNKIPLADAFKNENLVNAIKADEKAKKVLPKELR